jgi:hypothetical protein
MGDPCAQKARTGIALPRIPRGDDPPEPPDVRRKRLTKPGNTALTQAGTHLQHAGSCHAPSNPRTRKARTGIALPRIPRGDDPPEPPDARRKRLTKPGNTALTQAGTHLQHAGSWRARRVFAALAGAGAEGPADTARGLAGPGSPRQRGAASGTGVRGVALSIRKAADG